MPIVSIIVPVFNVESYLRECLDSVLRQSYPYFELIIVDDGSTDSSGSICDHYADKDSRVHVIHQENHGQGHARNVGMKLAVGKYIIFLDSDDYWDLHTLEQLTAEMQAKDLTLLYFSAEPFIDGAEAYKAVVDYTLHAQIGLVKSGPEYLACAFENGEFYGSSCLCMYLLSYLRSQELVFPEGILHEDESFAFLSCLYAPRVECIEDRFYKRRYRPGSTMTSHSIQRSAYGYTATLEMLENVYQNQNLTDEQKTLLQQRLKVYLGSICRCYAEAVKMDNHIAHTIANDSREARRALRRLVPSLNRRERLLTYSLWAGYWLPKLKSRLRKVLN